MKGERSEILVEGHQDSILGSCPPQDLPIWPTRILYPYPRNVVTELSQPVDDCGRHVFVRKESHHGPTG